MANVALSNGVMLTLQDGVIATGNGKHAVLPPALRDHTFYIIGSGTISGGTILIEEASDPDSTNTWALVGTVTASDVTAGAEKAVHVIGTLAAARARVSVAIAGGGNVTVKMLSGRN